jgi:hypothetical protein
MQLTQARQLALKLVLRIPRTRCADRGLARRIGRGVPVRGGGQDRAQPRSSSALDYALAAEQHGAVTAADRAQLAWARARRRTCSRCSIARATRGAR